MALEYMHPLLQLEVSTVAFDEDHLQYHICVLLLQLNASTVSLSKYN